MKLIITKHAVRIFEQHGRLLSRTEKRLAIGTEVELNDSLQMFYDHRDQEAAQILTGRHRGAWVILSEVEELPWHLALDPHPE